MENEEKEVETKDLQEQSGKEGSDVDSKVTAEETENKLLKYENVLRGLLGLQQNESLDNLDELMKSYKDNLLAESEKKLNEYKFDVEVSKALTCANVADEISVKANIDMSKVKFDEKGNLTGLEEQLNKLKENKPFLFKAEQKPKLNFGGSTPGIGHKNISGLKGAIEEHYKN